MKSVSSLSFSATNLNLQELVGMGWGVENYILESLLETFFYYIVFK